MPEVIYIFTPNKSYAYLEIRKNNVISTNPFVYWQRVSRTTLYALSSHFIVYNFFLLQAYFLHISLKAHLSK